MANTILIEFGTFYLMFWWCMAILYKNNRLSNHLSNLSIKIGQNNAFGGGLLEMSMCKFCMESHTATILAISYYFYCYDYKVLIWGFLCASINNWLRTFLE